MQLKSTGIIFFFLLFALGVSSQQEYHNYFQGDLLQQSQKFNPSFFSKTQKHAFALSGFYYQLNQDGPSYWDLFRSGGEGIIDVGKALSSLKIENYIRGDVEVASMQYTRGFEQSYFSIGHSIKLTAFLNFPLEFLDVIGQGNYQYVGKQVEIGPEFQLTTYHELAMAYGRQFGNFTAGAKLKLLSGIQDLATAENSISLFTDPEFYQWHIDATYQINSSSLLSFDSITSPSFDFNGINFEKLNFLNPGFAFDLGLNYQAGPLNLSASVLDIGRISWSLNPRQYTSRAKTVFEGLTISDILSDTIQVLDSVNSVLVFEQNEDAYTRNLPMTLIIGFDYSYNQWKFGALYHQENFRSYVYSAFAISARRYFNEKHSIAIQYAYRSSNIMNIGLQGVTQLGPIQLYLGTDNILGLIKPYISGASNVRFGLNILINHKKKTNA